MNTVAQRVKSLEPAARELAAELGLELHAMRFVREGGRWVLRFTISRPGGTSIRDCEMFSRAIERLLDRLDLIPGRYYLEVESRGVH